MSDTMINPQPSAIDDDAIVRHFTKLVLRELKKTGTVKGVVDNLGIPYSVIKYVMTKKYGAISSVDIKNKLGVRKKITDKNQDRILNIKALYEEFCPDSCQIGRAHV